MPIGIIAVAWVSFCIVLLLFPPVQTVDAAEMSEFFPLFIIYRLSIKLSHAYRLRRRHNHGCLPFCFGVLDCIGEALVQGTYQDD